jgi:hypothetical protein
MSYFTLARDRRAHAQAAAEAEAGLKIIFIAR